MCALLLGGFLGTVSSSTGKEGMLSFRSVFAQDRSCWVFKREGLNSESDIFFFVHKIRESLVRYSVQRRIYFSPEKGGKTSVPIASHFLFRGEEESEERCCCCLFDEWKREKILNISFSRAVTIHHTPFLPRNFLCQITAILPGFFLSFFFSR